MAVQSSIHLSMAARMRKRPNGLVWGAKERTKNFVNDRESGVYLEMEFLIKVGSTLDKSDKNVNTLNFSN